jgi:hypothetical protein
MDLARAAASLKTKLRLLDAGRAWLALANQNEKNVELARVFHLRSKR